MADVEAPPWLKGLPLAPEYHPTEVEFEDPIGYILNIEQEAVQFGICKIVPPYLKAPKRIVINNLNSSLALSHDASITTAHGSSTPMSRSMGPSRSMSGTETANVSLGLQDGGKARFTTRRQQLGWTVHKSNALPQSVTHKLVWQSGDSYTLEQFEAKAKLFSRNRLGTSREMAPMSIETLFWKAACEKSIAIEYANDIPGSAFAEPRETRLDSSLRFLKHKWGLDEEPHRKQALEDGLGGQEEDQEDVRGAEAQMGDEAEIWKGSSKSETGHGSGCKLSDSAWNMRNVARSPGSLLRFMPDEVPGVTTPMVYIGMLFSWFAWHVEDHELHSLNYLHTGASKTWYAVPGEAAPALEEVVRVHGYGSQLNARDAFARLGEKTTVMSPELLVAAGVPCCRLVQNAGEYVVTFPRAYHLGFSHGFNCGEAANFATPGWLDVAREAAARRAAMNYLPMLSHQQLLYTLAMSLTARSSGGSTSEEGSSRLKENKRLGEEIVKAVFVSDVIDHNTLLGKLLDGGVARCLLLSETKCLNQPPPDTLQQVMPKQLEIGRAAMCAEDAAIQDRTLLPFSNPPSTNMVPGDSSNISLAETSHASEICTGATALSLDVVPPSVDSEDLKEPWKLHLNKKSSAKNCSDGDDFVTSLDWGTLPCAACGVLCYAGMAVVQPSQSAATNFRPLQSHVLGEGLESSMTGRADTKSADFHILPPAPSLELEETTPSDRIEYELTAVREVLTHDLSDILPLAKDHLSDATTDAEELHGGLAPIFSEGLAVVSSVVKAAGGGVKVVDMHSKGESLETAETLKHEVSTLLLEEDVRAHVSVIQLEVAKQKSHRKWHSKELDVCSSIGVGSEPGPDKHLTVKPAVPGPSVSYTSLLRVPKEAGGSSVCDHSTSQTPQPTEEVTEGRIVGHRKGDMTISSLQLLAAVYNGDSEADEDDENIERREEIAEEINVVGFPHLGTGGRLIDSVGLSADAPWDGISRSLPAVQCSSSFKQDCKEKSCAFTSRDVVSVSDSMARVFSPGGLLQQGVHRGTCMTSIHRDGLPYGDGLQFTASLMPSEKKSDGLKTVLNKEREEFQPDVEVEHVEKHVIEVKGHQACTEGSPRSTAVSNNNSVGPMEADNRSTWQALGCSTIFPSDVANEGMLVEVEETQLHLESATGLFLKGAARPRLLCLEHAVVAQQQLESIGGAHVIIICHSSFAKAEQQAKQVSLEIGRQHQWRLIPFQRVGDKELRIIRAAVAGEENMQGHGDWVGQLGLYVHEHGKILREIPAHISRDSLFGEQTRELRGRAVHCRNFLEEKLAIVGQWCGRGWQSDQLHPLLGGCRFMASQAEVKLLPPNSTSNFLENGRPRKVLRTSRFGEYSYDGRAHFEVRKSGRKRKTVLDLTVDHSDDDGEEGNRVLTIVCTNSTACIPSHDIGYPHTAISERRNSRNNRSERGQALEAAPEQAQLTWEKLGKRKKKDPESAKVSVRSISNSAQESAALKAAGCLTPLQWQYNRCKAAGTCVPTAHAQPCSSVEGVGRLQQTSTVNSSSITTSLSSPEESNLPQASANQTSENLWQEVPIAAADSLPLPLGLSEKTSVQLGHEEAPVSSSELRVEPPGGAVVTSATALHLCPDGALDSEASKCCSVIGGFLQRGAKLQALKKLCRLRGTHVSDSCSPLITHAQIRSQETLACSNTTRPRLIVRLKRKPIMGSTQVVKKPKLVEGDARVETLPSFIPGETDRLDGSRDRSDDANRITRAYNHNSCENNFAIVRVSGSRWKKENDLSPCRNITSNQGDETFPCTLTECAEVATCFTLPMQTPNIEYNTVSNCRPQPSSQGPSNEPGSQYSWPPCLVPIIVPPTGRVRSRRMKSMRWKSCIQVSPVRDEEDFRQTWEEGVMRDADIDDMVMIKQDLETNNCVGHEADPDFFSNSSCLTSSSTTLRFQRVTTARTIDWRVDNADIDPDEREEQEEDTKSKKRRKARKPSSQKRGEELEGKFQCDLDGCYMAFDTEDDLEMHKGNRCTWKGCGKHFHMHKYLLQHRRVHLNDRPLKCPWNGCPQAFKWAWARTEHIRVHTGERPYKCSVSGCGQTFRFVSDFSRHKRNTGHRPS